MLGKLKALISESFRDSKSFFCVKGCLINFTGNGGSDPTNVSSYNVQAVTRFSPGVYFVDLIQDTFYGVDISNNSTISCSWKITPTASTDAFDVSASVSGGIITVTVYELTVVASKIVRVLYDIQSSDTISITLITSGGAELPPL
jgi:hypothetical protein